MATNQYKVIEDNAGGLFLFVFNSAGTPVALVHGLEESHPGEWLDVRSGLEIDPAVAVETWEQQELDPQEMWDTISQSDFGYELVCDNGALHTDRMGRAAQRYFGINAE